MIFRMVQWITERQDEDHMVNPDYPKDKKANPWLEQKKCVLL